MNTSTTTITRRSTSYASSHPERLLGTVTTTSGLVSIPIYYVHAALRCSFISSDGYYPWEKPDEYKKQHDYKGYDYYDYKGWGYKKDYDHDYKKDYDYGYKKDDYDYKKDYDYKSDYKSDYKYKDDYKNEYKGDYKTDYSWPHKWVGSAGSTSMHDTDHSLFHRA